MLLVAAMLAAGAPKGIVGQCGAGSPAIHAAIQRDL